MLKSSIKRTAIAAFAVGLSFQSASAATECAVGVSSALDQQRQRYIDAQADMASQNFSKRPGSFASTTCLDNLMTSGGLDIFFKPPSLDSLLGMVKNLSCEQASQIFQSLVGGGGLNSGSLQPGEILSGVDLGGNLLSSGSSSGYSGLVQSLIGSGSASGSGSAADISTSLKNVFQ
ncbi:hypothetical protein GOB57_08610 [Sinorhizobium meliloti]|nr:hypothetical protein [Sinorhizobium meliloti]